MWGLQGKEKECCVRDRQAAKKRLFISKLESLVSRDFVSPGCAAAPHAYRSPAPSVCVHVQNKNKMTYTVGRSVCGPPIEDHGSSTVVANLGHS